MQDLEELKKALLETISKRPKTNVANDTDDTVTERSQFPTRRRPPSFSKSRSQYNIITEGRPASFQATMAASHIGQTNPHTALLSQPVKLYAQPNSRVADPTKRTPTVTGETPSTRYSSLLERRLTLDEPYRCEESQSLNLVGEIFRAPVSQAFKGPPRPTADEGDGDYDEEECEKEVEEEEEEEEPFELPEGREYLSVGNSPMLISKAIAKLQDMTAEERGKALAAMDSEDQALAMQAMPSTAQRWRALQDVPPQVRSAVITSPSLPSSIRERLLAKCNHVERAACLKRIQRQSEEAQEESEGKEVPGKNKEAS